MKPREFWIDLSAQLSAGEPQVHDEPGFERIHVREVTSSAEGREMSVLSEPWFKAFKLASSRGDFLRNASDDHVERAFKAGFEFDRTTYSADVSPCTHGRFDHNGICHKCGESHPSPTDRQLESAIEGKYLQVCKERDAYCAKLQVALSFVQVMAGTGWAAAKKTLEEIEDAENVIAQYEGSRK